MVDLDTNVASMWCSVCATRHRIPFTACKSLFCNSAGPDEAKWDRAAERPRADGGNFGGWSGKDGRRSVGHESGSQPITGWYTDRTRDRA